MATIEESIERLGGLRGRGGRPLAPMPEAEIAALERALGARLPGDYRRFLATWGASSFNHPMKFTSLEPLQPHISDKTTRGHFGWFYGAATAGFNSVSDNTTSLRDRMPETIIPIGTDLFGNQFCIGVAGPQRGKVYFWDHDEDLDVDDYLEDYGPPIPHDLKFHNVHLIANSFEEFLDQMYPDEDV